jgi:hypothetical protein
MKINTKQESRAPIPQLQQPKNISPHNPESNGKHNDTDLFDTFHETYYLARSIKPYPIDPFKKQ